MGSPTLQTLPFLLATGWFGFSVQLLDILRPLRLHQTLPLNVARVERLASQPLAASTLTCPWDTAQGGTPQHLMAELLLNTAAETCSVTVKSDAPPPAAERFATLLATALTEMQ